MVKPKGYIPDCGDIIWLSFDPREGHEQAGRRPAVVLSMAAYNKRSGLALCCPITSRIKGYPFEVLIENKKISGVVLSDQLRSMDWRARHAEYVCSVKKQNLHEIRLKVAALIGL